MTVVTVVTVVVPSVPALKLVWDTVVVEVSETGSDSVNSTVDSASMMRIASIDTAVMVSPALKLVWDSVVVEVGVAAIGTADVVRSANWCGT